MKPTLPGLKLPGVLTFWDVLFGDERAKRTRLEVATARSATNDPNVLSFYTLPYLI